MKLLQCGCGRYFLAGEAICPACGAPLSMARYVTDPKTKKRRTVVGISVLLLLILTVGLMAVLQLGPFHPTIRLPALSVGELTEADSFAPPTEEDKQAVADYLEAVKRNSYLNMSFSERETAKQMVALIDVMARGGDIQPEQLAEAIGQDGDAFRAEVDEMLRQAEEAERAAQEELAAQANAPIRVSYSQLVAQTTEGRMILLSSEEEAQTADTAEEEEITLASREQHGSWVQLNKKREVNDRICPNCSYLNEEGADVCEQCGCSLAHHLMYAEIEEKPEVVPAETEEEDIPIYTAQLLNNIANELILHGYADIPFYLACLANMQAPEDTDVLCTIAELLKTSGHYEDALAIANYGLRYYPNDEDTLYVAGMCAIKLDDPDLAAGYFNRALKISGGGGPGNQGMMLVSIQRQDFGSAFLYMIEGARDAFTHSIWEVYQAMKLRPDYEEISSNAFEQYSLYELMKFERNRTAFDPTLDTVGQQITLGNLVWPSRVQDWRHSCFSMLESCISYGKDLASALTQETGEVVEALDILLNAKDFKDLAQRFASSSFMPDEKTEAEEQISYEQEMFWLSILGDYVDWKLGLIEEQHAKEIPADEVEEITQLAFDYLEETWAGVDLSALEFDYTSMSGWVSYAQTMLQMMRIFESTVIENHSYWTVEQSQNIVSRMNNVIDTYSDSVNKAYTETKILLEEYWLYANAILGLIADDTIYNEYRAEQRYRVATAPTIYILETALWSFTNIFINDGIPMLGTPADGGAITGTVPSFPKLPVSGKGATPEALMYGDIYVPNIGKVTQQVIGMTQEEIEEALELQRMLTYQDNYDKMIAEMTPEQRVKFEAYRADPNCVNRTIILQPYNASGGPVFGFYSEKIPYATGTAEMKIGSGDKPIAKLSYDSNGNMGISIKDMAGIETTPQDVTMFIGGSKGLDILDKFKLESEGVSVAPDIKAEASARIFATYNYRTGKFTSGGAKAGASARIGGMAGLEGELSHNVVTGLSQSDISTIWFGHKFGIKGLWSWKWP